VLWNRDNLDGPETELRHLLIDSGTSDSHILRYPNTRIAQYLEIPSRGRGIQCITFYCTPLGTSRIRLNGTQDDTIGVPLPDACPITAYFLPDEFITAIFHVTKNVGTYVPFAGPCITV
jgi:hypothetical protein